MAANLFSSHCETQANRNYLYVESQQYFKSIESILQEGLSPQQRLDYVIKLREYLVDLSNNYSSYLPLPEDISSLLVDIIKQLCDWPLLTILQSSHIISGNILALAEAHFYMGDKNAAKQCLEKELLADPYNQRLHNCWRYVSSEPVSNTDLLHDGEIYLTELNDHHMEAFSWQYSKSVKELCNLPDIENLKDWHDWYTLNVQDPDRVVFAVMHIEWGFIGCVNLQVYDGIGFFYYWLGEDFQGQGFGPRAVSRLLDYGYHYMEMDCCYAKVFECNTVSHKAIQKLGFNILPFSALPPYEDEVFYYCGEALSQAALFNDLQYLFYKMDSLIQLVPDKLEAC